MKLEKPENMMSTPTVIPRPDHNISRKNISSNALKVLYRLNKSNFQAYLVGGCVRDLLLGREPKDFDVATDALPEQIKSLFRNCRLIGRRFRLAHIHFGKEIIEVATFRGPATEQESEVHSLDSGMIIRDNAYGSLESDAWRRDFTVNSLYYSIKDFSVIDYVNGLQDLDSKTLRPIGEPNLRFREDPVRMLRAVRFAAKLDFNIETSSYASILKSGDCLLGVPPARLFDEILKLFLSGSAKKTYQLLLQANLLQYLFPQTTDILSSQSDPSYGEFLLAALHNTDVRVLENKPVTPAFLAASLLWPMVRLKMQAGINDGMKNTLALQEAMYDVVETQTQRVSIPRRISVPMRDIWSFQLRLERRTGKRPLRILTHPRFRAAFDFLELRALSGESEQVSELYQWWQQFQNANGKERQGMVKQKNKPATRKRRNRKRNDAT